jgi:hypothetical protein
VLQIALWSLAASTAFTGVPAAFAPRSFYDSFPAGLSWVSKLPPYNEHLIVDVGGFYLAFTFLFVYCALTLRRAAIVPIALAWIGVQTLHTGYHLLHLQNFTAAEAIGQTAGFAVFLVLPSVALALTADLPAQAARSS